MMRQQTGVREHFSLRQYGSYLDCRAAGSLRGVRARHDLRCMVRPCVARGFCRSGGCAVLHQRIRASRRKISARAISLADRPRTGHSGHHVPHPPGRPILHLVSSSRRLGVRETGCGARHCGLPVSMQFLCSCREAVPSSRPALVPGAAHRGRQGWPSRLACLCRRHMQAMP